MGQCSGFSLLPGLQVLGPVDTCVGFQPGGHELGVRTKVHPHSSMGFNIYLTGLNVFKLRV